MTAELLDTLLALHQARSPEKFTDATLELFDQAFPASLISFDYIGPEADGYAVRLNRAIPDFSNIATAVARCVARDNPLVAHFASLNEDSRSVAVERLSDHLSPEAFRATELYRVGFAPFGVAFQLAVMLRKERGFVALGVNRASDFTDEELALARRLAEHARHALDARLWFNARLIAGSTRSPPKSALQALTPREREVRRWLAEGKRNAEIATILGCSRATVKKHCENIYRKLGVENRTSAGFT